MDGERLDKMWWGKKRRCNKDGGGENISLSTREPVPLYDFKQKTLPTLINATRFSEENKTPPPRWRLKFPGEPRSTSSAWVPVVSSEWESGPAARPRRGARTGGRRGAAGRRGRDGHHPGERRVGDPRLGRAPEQGFQQTRPRLPASAAPKPPDWWTRGARRRGYHGFRGSRGRSRELPAARRGGPGAGRPGRGRGAAAAGAGGAGDAASPPRAALAQLPPLHQGDARRASRAAGPTAPRLQPVAPPAPPAPARRPQGRRPVRGGGEGGAQAPAARQAR